MIWLAVLLPGLAGLALWALGGEDRCWLGAAAAVALAASAAAVLAAAATGRFDWAPGLALHLGYTSLSRAVALTVPAVGFAVVLYAAAHEAVAGLARLIGLLLVFTGAMQLVVAAADLLTLLIGWEIMGACSWALIGHRWRGAMPSAGYAFVMTRAGDLGLFLAVFACFAAGGRLEYAVLGELTGSAAGLAAFGLLVAAAAKAGQGPFAPWLFRAMDGPTSVSALLHSSTMVAAGAFLLARLHPWIGDVPGFGAACLALGLVTALAGGLVAATQLHAKRVLAGSTSAQIGLMFAAVGAGFPGVAILHLIAHAAVKAPLFFAAGIAHRVNGSFDLRHAPLGRRMPLVSALVALPALALAGVPPLGAVWTKEEIVAAAAEASDWALAAALLAGALSAAYAARFLLLSFGPGAAGHRAGEAGETFALGLLSAATLVLSLLWLPAAHKALPVPLPHGGTLELLVSLGLVALGLLTAVWLARHPAEVGWSDWFGLPRLIDRAVTRPSLAAAALAARVDDRVFDALPRAAAAGDRRLAAQIDDRVFDLLPRAVAAGGRRLAHGLDTADARGLDGLMDGSGRGALALLVRLARALARGASRGGEAAADLLPRGSAHLSWLAGGDARRLQTGMSHHYYALFAAALALAALVLILGA